jgi:hypothetical protein
MRKKKGIAHGNREWIRRIRKKVSACEGGRGRNSSWE